MADDANKRINLTAPLLSVRRHGGGGGADTAATATGSPAPAYNYKADATSSEPHTTSAVPFGWEHRPGHPKSVRTRRLLQPPPPQPPLTTIVDVDDEPASRVTRNPTAPSERARSDARCSADALSRDDGVSCVTVNCSSATGLSDAAAGSGTVPGPPCARHGSVMLDRFLPAAHAVAAGSPQNTFRKAGLAGRAAVVLGAPRTAGANGDRPLPAQRRVPPLQHIAGYHYHLTPLSPSPCGKKDGNNDDGANSDAHSPAGFASSKRCRGLLSTRCVKSALLLSCGARRGAGRPFQSNDSQREKKALLQPRSRNGPQNQPQQNGDDHGMQSWEEVYIKSLLRSSGPGGLMGPAAAVASELDRTVRELYKRRDGQAVRPKASHLGLLLVLDRSNEACGHGSPARRKLSRTGDTAALLLKATTTKSPPISGGGGYGFPLLLEDKEAVDAREIALSPHALLSLPLPMSPTESWLSRTLTSVSTRPPGAATSFLGLHVQPKKHAAATGPWCSVDSLSRGRDVDVHHDRKRQSRVHDLQK